MWGIVHLMAFPNLNRADRSGNDGGEASEPMEDSTGRIRSRRWWNRR